MLEFEIILIDLNLGYLFFYLTIFKKNFILFNNDNKNLI